MMHSVYPKYVGFIIGTLSLGAILVSVSPAGADLAREVWSAVTCSNATACKTFTNSGTGAGVLGTSAKGSGLIGQTKFNSTSSSNGQAGVLGSDLSTSGTFDAGVKGTSTTGDGVLGTTNGGGPTVAGVVGVLGAPSGVVTFAAGGVLGDSKSSDGVLGTSATLNGVLGLSGTANGVLGLTENPSQTTGKSGFGVIGDDASNDGGGLNIGVVGESTNGIGVQGSSTNFVGVNAVGGFDTSTGQIFPALSVVRISTVGGVGELIAACQSGAVNPCDSRAGVFDVDSVGDVFAAGFGEILGVVLAGDIESAGSLTVGSANPPSSGSIDISGQYLKDGSCVAGCAPPTERSAGRGIESYASQSTAPTLEDFGEAQLVAGQAYVALSSDFANAIDQRGYLVFITPEGDSRGLYVTSKTAQGFVVRENGGGRSNIAFGYRVVAKPYGDDSARLPTVVEPPLLQITPHRLSHLANGPPSKSDHHST